MKRKICNCLFLCLLFISAAILNIQVHANIEIEETYYDLSLPEGKDGIYILEFTEGIGESKFVAFNGFEERDVESLSVTIKDKNLVKLEQITKIQFAVVPLRAGKTTLTVTMKLKKAIEGKTVWKWTVNTVMEGEYTPDYTDPQEKSDSSSEKSKKSKVSMPESVESGYSDADGYCFPNLISRKISYDNNGRIKTISAKGQSTGSSWTYTFSYKSSGKNIIATVKYKQKGNDATQKYTYKFNSKGRLTSNNDSSSYKWSYADEKKSYPMMVSDNSACVFQSKGPLRDYELENGKVTAFYQFNYKNGQPVEKEYYFFDEPVLLKKAMKTDKNDDMYLFTNTYNVKTKKVSMTKAVRWMNMILLLDFVYA